MATIRPISDLRNHADRISDICHSNAEPVFITKNGQNDLVVLSHALFDQLQARLELYQKLEEAEIDAERHPRGLSHKAMMAQLNATVK